MKIIKLVNFSFLNKSPWEVMTNSPWGQSTFITILCLVAYLTGPICMYESNDDVYYNLVFSGQLVTSTPSPYCGVVNYVLSEAFTSLYAGIPVVPWYGAFHILSIFMATFFLNYFYSISRGCSKLAARLVISIVCSLPFLFYIQFTKTSFVLAITGYLGLYLLNSVQLRSRIQTISLYSIAAIFLILSFSLRKESFLMATLLCGFLMAYALMNRKTALILSLSATAAIIIILALVHKQNYGIEWQSVSERWGKVFGSIIDYDQIDYDANKEVFIKAGWSRNDYNFLKIWGFADERIYGQKQTDYIFKNSTRNKKISDISATLQGAVSYTAKDYIFTATGLVLLLMLMYRHQYVFFCIYVLVPFVLCIAVLVWQGRFPPRVSTAMVYFLPWVTLVISGQLRKKGRLHIISAVTLLVLVIPLYSQFKTLSELAKNYLRVNNDLHRLGKLVAKKPVNLITVGQTFPFEGILPFESPEYLSGARFIWLCSMNQGPIQKRQIAECGMQDIFVSLLSDPATFIIIQPEWLVFLQRYIWEHYDIKTVVAPIYGTKQFIIFKITADSKSMAGNKCTVHENIFSAIARH